MWLSYDQIVGLIRGAGKEPVERDSLYQTVRTFEDWVPGQSVARATGPEGPTFQISHRPRARARGQQSPPVLQGVDSADAAESHATQYPTRHCRPPAAPAGL